MFSSCQMRVHSTDEMGDDIKGGTSEGELYSSTTIHVVHL
jgi:hypothetical protein